MLSRKEIEESADFAQRSWWDGFSELHQKELAETANELAFWLRCFVREMFGDGLTTEDLRDAKDWIEGNETSHL